MKKIMIAALMVLGTSTAFAGDSEALKAIVKAKSYAEAASLLKSSLSQLASDAEKAKAYNHLVTLALEKYNAQKAIQTENQAAELTQKPVQPLDTVGFYNAAYDALMNALECYKYDNMPDAKGKVKPKFFEALSTTIPFARLDLVQAGQHAAQISDDAGVLKYWGALLDTKDSELIQKSPKASDESAWIGQVAYFTALFANQEKLYDQALRYLDIAITDPEYSKEAQGVKFGIAQQNLKTQADTLKFIDELKAFYQDNSDSEAAFGTLCNLYAAMNKKDEVMNLVNDKISKDPNNYTAWALKGQSEMNDQDYDNAIESFKHAVEIDGTNPVVLTYLGFSMNAKAAGIEGNIPAQKALYKESMTYLERARDIDPDRQKANWAYPLYQCYYINYSANDPRTKEMEEMLK